MKQTMRVAELSLGIPRFTILGVQISAIDITTANRAIEEMITHKIKGYVCVCPVSTIMECVDDPRVRQAVNAASLVTPDGMPTVWIGRRRGFKGMARVYGPDLMLEMCASSEQKGWNNFLYGSTPEVLEKLEVALRKRFPQILICGKYSPPFRPLSLEEEEAIVKKINDAKADLVWVGLGSPKQDLWMAQHRGKITAPVMLGVGAAFDFIAGTKPQAPRWMQRAGCEWLFRLCSEPRRLWRRYLLGNARFVFLLMTSSLNRKNAS